MLRVVRETLEVSSPEIGDVEILLLARMFGVSFEVAARRCEDLELLPSGGATSLTAQLKKDYGNPEQRAEKLGLPDRAKTTFPAVSKNLVAAIIEKVRSGEKSVGWASDNFGLSIGDIYAANAALGEHRELRH